MQDVLPWSIFFMAVVFREKDRLVLRSLGFFPKIVEVLFWQNEKIGDILFSILPFNIFDDLFEILLWIRNKIIQIAYRPP